MALFLYGNSALWYLRAFKAGKLPLRFSVPEYHQRARANALRFERNVFSTIDLCNLASTFPDIPLPIHVATTLNKRRMLDEYIFHATKDYALTPSYFKISDDLYCATPELCFLQLARERSFEELVFVGNELCGGFVGNETHLEALTTTKQIQRLIAKAGNLHGTENAKTALSVLVDSCDSPMEALLAALLSVSVRHGGLGLRILANYKIELSDEARNLYRHNYCKLDMFAPKYNLAFEYDSNQYHTNAARINEDARRRNALELMGIHIVTVTNEQLKNPRAFAAFEQLVYSLTGKRYRFQENCPHAQARNQLLHHLRKVALTPTGFETNDYHSISGV